jgi:predicted hydrocarbon binding protein
MGKKKIFLLADPRKGELYFNGVSSLIDTRKDEARIQQSVERILGDVAKILIYNASKKTSVRKYSIIRENLILENKKITKKEFVIYCLNELKIRGNGVAELTTYDKEKLVFLVSIKNCFNTAGYENAKKSVCHIMSGRLAGIFEVAFGKEMECKEINCKAVNGKGCLFAISSFGRNAKIPGSRQGQKYILKKRSGLNEVEFDYDGDNGYLFLQGNSSVIGFREYWSIYQQEIERIIGPATKAIFYDIGKVGTIDSMDNIMKYVLRVLRILSIKRIIGKVIEQTVMRGYGITKSWSFDERTKILKMRMRNCFNASGYYGKAKKPVCYEMTGTIAGALQMILGIEMTCTETKCEGKGDRYCEFVAKPE